jgi:CRISPR-associated protein Cmr1
MRAQFDLTIATPLSVGWYRPNILDTQSFIRPTSIKGVWRWWARTFVGGVLYERGCLRARRGKLVFLEPDRDVVRRISQITGKVLGLGYAGGGDASASRFRIVVSVLGRPYIGSVTRASRYVEYGYGKRAEFQRFNLLSLSDKVEYALGGRFRLEISGRGVDSKIFTLGLQMLAVALTFSGLGKGSRKGLGSLDVTWSDFLPRISVGKLIEEVRASLENLITDRCGGPQRELPPMPVMTKASLDMRLASVYRVVGLDAPSLHNFFLRPQRARVTTGSPMGQDELRRRLEAWVLGLPREQRGTGYIAEVDRRASTFMVAYHGQGHWFNSSGEAGGYLTVLVSGDWPTSITWSNSGERELSIDAAKVISAYSTAFREFEDYVKKMGGTVAAIW